MKKTAQHPAQQILSVECGCGFITAALRVICLALKGKFSTVLIIAAHKVRGLLALMKEVFGKTVDTHVETEEVSDSL